MQSFSKDLIADGDLNSLIGMWWVHLLFCGIAFVAYQYPAMARRFSFGAGS